MLKCRDSASALALNPTPWTWPEKRTRYRVTASGELVDRWFIKLIPKDCSQVHRGLGVAWLALRDRLAAALTHQLGIQGVFHSDGGGGLWRRRLDPLEHHQAHIIELDTVADVLPDRIDNPIANFIRIAQLLC